MGLNQRSGSESRKYLRILKGKIVLNVEEGTEGSVSRENKNGKIVHELIYDSVSGKISSITLDDSEEYGTQYVVHIKDSDENYSLVIPVDSNYGDDLGATIKNLNFDKYITISPWDFTTKEGDRKTGITFYEKENEFSPKPTKVEKFFNKENNEGLPVFPKPNKKGVYDKDDLKIYRTLLRKTYKNIITEMFESVEEEGKVSEPSSSNEQPDDLPF